MDVYIYSPNLTAIPSDLTRRLSVSTSPAICHDLPPHPQGNTAIPPNTPRTPTIPKIIPGRTVPAPLDSAKIDIDITAAPVAVVSLPLQGQLVIVCVCSTNTCVVVPEVIVVRTGTSNGYSARIGRNSVARINNIPEICILRIMA